MHLAYARGGLLVGSVIAADEAVPEGDVLAVAEAIVTAEARRPRSAPHLSLYDLPLGDGPVWSIREEQVETTAPDGKEEQVVSVLPAWSAETDLDLADDAELGFAAAARIIAEALELKEWYYKARQAATARYSAVGFEAAAVTALGVLTATRVPRPGCGEWPRCALPTDSPWWRLASMTTPVSATPSPPAGKACRCSRPGSPSRPTLNPGISRNGR